MAILMIFVGGGLGSVSRFLLGNAIQGNTQGAFPFGTLAVNVLGGLAVGILARLFMPAQEQSVLRAALVVGFCGGFTTFSTFSLEAYGLFTSGKALTAVGYTTASVVLSIAATAAGFALTPALTR